jgi:hypothetical protein
MGQIKGLELKGYISDFYEWYNIIYKAVLKFYKKYNVYPNLLLACDVTFRKIDLNAQRYMGNIVSVLDNGLEEIETIKTYDGINHFRTEECGIDFGIDNELTEGNFILLFADPQDIDGEPVPVPEEKENVFVFKKTA